MGKINLRLFPSTKKSQDSINPARTNWFSKRQFSIIYFLMLSPILGSFLSCSHKLPSEVVQAYELLPDEIDFNYHIRPILSDRCFACHGPDANARKANLRLDIEARAFGALESDPGFAFVRNKPHHSLAIKRILSTDKDQIMPPPDSKMTLSYKEKALLIKWLEQGGEWKNHWSFIPPIQRALPKVNNPDLIQNPIDHFILAELEGNGLSFSEKADKATLLRRVYLDLIGLPPSLEVLEKFLNDNSPDAFENVVDRLLASPNFGERWAWEWLDAARYSDTNGFQADPTRKMWPWRDWVVKAINDNKPYDQFTIEQLAGDLIPNATRDQILATAFNRNHMYNGEGGRIAEETRVENVFDRLETTGTIWMGITFNCTRCHDHKFDPISQQEYFQFFDYFNQTSEAGLNGNGMIPPVLDMSPKPERTRVEELKATVEAIALQVEAYEATKFPSESGIASESPAASDLNGTSLYELSFRPAKRNPYYVGLIREHFQDRDPVYAELLGELKAAMDIKNREGNKNLQVMVMDQVDQPRATYVLDKGAYDRPVGEPLQSGVPAILPPLPDDAPNDRLGLAQWLVSQDHPLTARVTVNRFWQTIFGRGIVKTPEDFGIQGALPSHPELLDWLALHFIQENWNVKALIKLIVLSRTYQQASKVNAELLQKDPENLLLSRSPRYRLPSWMIRDQALFISGLLYDSIGGPPVKPYQPEGIWEEATFGQIKYERDHGNALYRRSLYIFWRRIVGPTMLFDNSTRQFCSVKSSQTNSPQHALITLNDVTYLEAAKAMAERVLMAKETNNERLNYAFRLATSRYPESEEKLVLEEKLNQFRTEFYQNKSISGDILEIGEYPSNPDLDPNELASYTALCSMLLNLDETISKQ